MSAGLASRVAFITGAAHGQGRATALALAREGVHVAALDVARPLGYPGYALGTPGELESLAAECQRLGVRCLTFPADVRDDAAVSAAVERATRDLGRLDILFNNAGICGYGLAHELTEEAWDAMLDVNLKGAWLVARRVIPHMVQRRSGVIINNSSVLGLRGAARLSHYAASKWGLVGLTRSWAIELAPYNIRVVSLHPTGVNTPMNDGLAGLEGLAPEQLAVRSAGNLLPVPWVEPEDVAAAVVFLASDKARFLTGSPFILDAGLLTR
jgi:NAD(P)-dependent dehydrogenase (short-subunit alcohol dehydrogenase family)